MSDTASASNRSTGFYAPELDSLRALAVAAVMITHFSGTLNRFADWGVMGVRLFFVLSGFLITQLLLRSRERIDARISTTAAELRRFFVRRIFRLWPLYFASLLASYFFHVGGTETNIWWHLLFATNQYVFHYQNWPALLSHFWTLAVEQQFYFVWPLLVLFLPHVLLPRLLIAFLLTGPAARAILIASGTAPPDIISVLLVSCLDFFAAGAIVAYWRKQRQFYQVLGGSALSYLIAGLFVWLALGTAVHDSGHQPRYWIVCDGFAQAIGFAALLAYLLQASPPRAARALRQPILVYLGRISYGIYVFHNFMHWLAPSVLLRITGYAYFKSETAHVLLLTGFSIAIASMSFHLFEEPVRKLGRRLAA